MIYFIQTKHSTYYIHKTVTRSMDIIIIIIIIIIDHCGVYGYIPH